MGELVKNKQEGYFPANYVQDKSIYENLNRGPISPIKMPSNKLIPGFEKIIIDSESNYLI